MATSNPQAVDNAILRLQTAYDTAGRAFRFSSYASATSSTSVNEVQRNFNGFGQLTVEYQSHSGAVDTTPSTGSLRVQYAYSNDAKSRLVSMTYPNGRILHYEYNTGVDSTISRLSFIADDTSGSAGTHLEEYSYLGLSTLVKRAHPQPGVDLSYIKQSGESNGAAGDQYAGLDRFDRVVDQRWIKTSNTTSTDRFKYGYDENGNVMYKDNVLSSANSELYHANGSTNGYDSLNRLAAFQRGALNTAKDSISGTVGRSQSWNLDALGNWDGASGVTTDGTAQSRTHNRRNQATAVNGATLTFDNNGNTTKDENGITYIYDACGVVGSGRVQFSGDETGRDPSNNGGSQGPGRVQLLLRPAARLILAAFPSDRTTTMRRRSAKVHAGYLFPHRASLLCCAACLLVSPAGSQAEQAFRVRAEDAFDLGVRQVHAPAGELEHAE